LTTARCFSAPTIRAEEAAGASKRFHLTGSKPEDIDVVVPLDEADLEAMRRALDCYVTYAETIERSGIKRGIPREAVFELYQEAHDPPLESLLDELPAGGRGKHGQETHQPHLS
jgi:hypothetical protein